LLKDKIIKKNINKVNNVMSNFAGRPFKVVVTGISIFMVILPLYWLFINSVKYEQDYMAVPPVIIPAKITFGNYVRIFINDGVASAMYNSIVIAVVATVICVFFGSLAAYSIVKGKSSKKLRNAFAFWFLIQKMYPAIATAIPIFLVMRKLDLIDTQVSLIIMNVSFNLPLIIWLLIGFFEDVPNEIEESGMIDGCNMWQRYFHLIIPITKPALIASAILTFVGTWNEFLFAAILSVRRAKTLPVIIAGFITDRGLEWGPMAAMGVILIIPVIIIVWALQKDFVAGLSMGSVKG
jgi:ABC-type glycerol-3-phosphate transport system permease component